MTTAITSYDDKLAEMAQRYSATHAASSGAQFISTKSGVFSVGDTPVAGNELIAVVVDSVLENTYYKGKYDPDDRQPPVCYAFGREKADLAPHETMARHPEFFVPQSEDCASCQWNVFGSAETGRGKACQNRARLALLPAGMLVPEAPKSKNLVVEFYDDPQHFREAEIMTLKLSPTSVAEEWNKYVAMLASQHRRPPLAFITRIWIAPHPKHQFHVKFEMLEPLAEDLLGIVLERNEKEAVSIISAYQPPEEAAPQARGVIRGVRRQQ